MFNKKIIAFVACLLLVFTGVFATKIMIVHSYDENYSWTEELTKGIQSVFEDKEIEWDIFYMETRLKTSEEWKIKAGRLALQRVEKFSPDIIIACDDNAQEYFAKEITDIPVVFCGVNLEPSKYAYPRKNVAGVRETLFTKELIGMIKDFFPEISNIVFMGDKSETTSGIVEQIEESEYEGIKKNILILDTYANWKETVKSFDDYNTAVVLLINRELKDENGEAVASAEVTRWTVNNSTVPVFAIMNYAIEEGTIGGVVNRGYCEGKQAGEIVRKFLSGTSLKDVDLEKLENGYVMLNVASALSAGVSFDSEWFERWIKLSQTGRCPRALFLTCF